MDYSLNNSSHRLESPRRARLPVTPNCIDNEGNSCVIRDKLIAKRRFPDVSTPPFIPEKFPRLSITEVKRLNDSVIENDVTKSADVENDATESADVENDAIDSAIIKNDAAESAVIENAVVENAVTSGVNCSSVLNATSGINVT